MKDRLTALKTSLLKKCPTYNTEDYLEQVRALAAKDDAEAQEFLALRTAAHLLHMALAPTYQYELLTATQRRLIAKSDFDWAIAFVREFPLPAQDVSLYQTR